MTSGCEHALHMAPAPALRRACRVLWQTRRSLNKNEARSKEGHSTVCFGTWRSYSDLRMTAYVQPLAPQLRWCYGVGSSHPNRVSKTK